MKEMAQESVASASLYVMHAQEANMNVSRAIDQLPDIDPMLVMAVKDNTQCVQRNVEQCESKHDMIELTLNAQRAILSEAETIAQEANETFHFAETTCKCPVSLLLCGVI